MKKNPTPSTTIKGTVTREGGAKPKPHEYTTTEALADSGCTTTACIERNLRKAVNHQSANIVIDSFRMKNIQDRSIQSFLLKRLELRHGIKRIIFVNRKREAIDINNLLR